MIESKPSAAYNRLISILLLAVIIVGFSLRVYNLQYDGGMNGHPDERSTTCGYAASLALPQSWEQFWDPQQSTLNPLWDVQQQTRRSFTYGHFPLYLGVAMGELFHALTPTVSALGAPVWMVERMERANTPCEGVAIPGRFTIALLDTLTIFLLFLLGRRIYGAWTGLIAAAFYAFTAQAIQLSHFFAMDPASTTFTVLAILGALKMAQERTLRAALLCGIGAGLAISSKFSALPILAAPVVAGILAWFDQSDLRFKNYDLRNNADDPSLVNRNSKIVNQSSGRAQLNILLSVPLALIVAIVAFALTSPYAILDATNFLQATLVEQGRMVRGLADMPFTRQYRNTTPYLYFLQQQIEWGMGYPLAAVVALGTLWAIVQLIVAGVKFVFLLVTNHPRWRLSQLEIGVIILWSWVLPYFGLTGAFLAKFNRYMSPVLPFWVLWGAGLIGLLWSIGQGDKETRRQGDKEIVGEAFSPSPPLLVSLSKGLSKGLAILLAIIGLAGGLFWGAAYVNGVYAQPHPWITGALWMKDNVPAGSLILCEQWDDCLPFGYFGVPEVNQARSGWSYIDWGPYEEDTAEKYQLMKQKLIEADYVIYSSKRIWASVDNLPERYPLTNLYYRSMFDGSLGFDLVSAVETYPQLFGFKFPDRDADESWSLYDHPQPLIFKKVKQLSDAEFDAKFKDSWVGAKAWYRGEDSPLSPFLNLLGLGNAPESEGSGLINKIINTAMGSERPQPPLEEQPSLLLDTPLNQLPVVDDYRWNRSASESTLLAVVWWWLIISLIGWLTWPLAFYVFAPLRDRGYLLSRTLGWLLTGWLLWMAASNGLLLNTVRNGWLIIGGLALFALIATIAQRRALGEFLRKNGWMLLTGEIIFALAYGFFVLIRMGNPDLWQPWVGGEKFMEFAFLNGSLRSPTFPPLDPHFAGGIINYYYFGLYLVAYLTKLTGIYAEVAFNLAIPTLFALTVLNTFAVAFSALQPATLASAGRLRQIAKAGLAPLFVTLIGNLDGGALLLRNLATLGQSQFQSEIPGLQTTVQAISGFSNLLTSEASLQRYDFWAPSRVIPATINEFPYWSFLFADLHPHLIGIPMAGLFIALMLTLLRLRNHQDLSGAPNNLTGQNDNFVGAPDRSGVHDTWGRKLALLALFSLLLGTLASINLWELPTYLGLGVLVFLVAQFRWRLRIDWLPTIFIAGFYAVGAYLLYWPFFRNYHNVGASGVGTVHTPDDSGLWLLIWGFLAFIVSSWLFYEATRPSRKLRIANCELRMTEVESPESEVLSQELGVGIQAESGVGEIVEPFVVAQMVDRANDDLSLPQTVALSEPAVAVTIPIDLDETKEMEPLLIDSTPMLEEPSANQETATATLEPINDSALRIAHSAPLSGVERWLSLAGRKFDRLPRLIYLQQLLVTQPRIGYLLSQLLLPALLLLALLCWWWGRTVLALCIVPMGLAWLLLWRRGRNADEGAALAALLSVTGFAILAGTQLIYLKDFLGGGDYYRMNTLFKFFSQVWVIWGVAAGIALPRIWDNYIAPSFGAPSFGAPSFGVAQDNLAIRNSQFATRLLRFAWAIIFTLLFLASLAFPIYGTPDRLDQRFPGWRPPFGTLNGLDYMNEGEYTWLGRDDDAGVEFSNQLRTELRYDRAAIAWLLDNVCGNPVIIESDETDYYRAAGTRIATMTGFSSPVGMHKGEQYYGEPVGERSADLRELWRNLDPLRTQELIDKLHVSLIYIGQLERYENAPGVAKFEQMATAGQLEIIYQNEKSTILAVPGRLTKTEQGYFIPQSDAPAQVGINK